MTGRVARPVLAGVVTALVGFGGAFPVVLAGLRAVGADERQAASGLLAVCVAAGVVAVVLGLRTRMPVSIAWSTPGAALLIAAGPQPGGFAAAVGAFLLCGGLIVLAGLVRPLGRLIAAIPAPIAGAMLAGVLLPLCLAPVKAVAEVPLLAVPVVLVWAVVLRFARPWAVPAALMAAAVGIVLTGPGLGGADLVPALVWTAPRFDPATLVGVGLPLFLVTMASQNVPGMAVLATYGYRPRLGPILGATGLGTLGAAPFGGRAVNLAAISAALAAGPDADPDPGRRWIASVTAGGGCALPRDRRGVLGSGRGWGDGAAAPAAGVARGACDNGTTLTPFRRAAQSSEPVRRECRSSNRCAGGSRVRYCPPGHLRQVILNHIRRGDGAPLVLVHGLGGSLRSWDLVVDGLAAHREVVALDLPGFGESPALPETTVDTLADAVALLLSAQGLQRADLVGTSLGGRLVLEMVRRGLGRHVVALDPGGYWNAPERAFVHGSLRASITAARRLRPVLPLLAGNPVTRTALLAQFSARPWAVPGDVVLRELRGLADAPAVDPALTSLMAEEPRQGAAAGTSNGRVVVGWGRWDRLTLPTQARRALAAFPGARLHRFAHSGHFPMFDSPDETVRVVLDATA